MKTMKKISFLKQMHLNLINLPTPSSISYMWNWGSTLGIFMLIQIITGILLTSHYNPSMEEAYNSTIHIMRNVHYGWTMRMIHMNSASMIFIMIFIHISRGMMFSSYKMTKTWFSGIMIIATLMATAFMGYVLPWGQMSFWGATVITNLMSAIPYLGKTMVQWLWGGFSINQATLSRFFTLHFILPFILMALMMIHLMSLHMMSSSSPIINNPNKDKSPFHPYFTWKDLMFTLTIMMIFLKYTMNQPYYLMDCENYNQANPLNTPMHIQPEWYFLFAYTILRSIPNKLGGVMALIMSIMIITILPTMKKMKKTIKMNPMNKINMWLFNSSFMMLTWSGTNPIEPPYELMSKIFSITYFITIMSICFLKLFWKQ